MVSRSLLALFAIALLFAVASAVAEEEATTGLDDSRMDDDAERGIEKWALKAAEKAIKEAAKFVKKEFKKVNKDCISEIYNTCDINPIAHPRKYLKCAKSYFQEHKANCYRSE